MEIAAPMSRIYDFHYIIKNTEDMHSVYEMMDQVFLIRNMLRFFKNHYKSDETS